MRFVRNVLQRSLKALRRFTCAGSLAVACVCSAVASAPAAEQAPEQPGAREAVTRTPRGDAPEARVLPPEQPGAQASSAPAKWDIDLTNANTTLAEASESVRELDFTTPLEEMRAAREAYEALISSNAPAEQVDAAWRRMVETAARGLNANAAKLSTVVAGSNDVIAATEQYRVTNRRREAEVRHELDLARLNAEREEAIMRTLAKAADEMKDRHRDNPTSETRQELLRRWNELRAHDIERSRWLRRARMNEARVQAWQKNTGRVEKLTETAQVLFGPHGDLARMRSAMLYRAEELETILEDRIVMDAVNSDGVGDLLATAPPLVARGSSFLASVDEVLAIDQMVPADDAGGVEAFYDRDFDAWLNTRVSATEADREGGE